MVDFKWRGAGGGRRENVLFKRCKITTPAFAALVSLGNCCFMKCICPTPARELAAPLSLLRSPTLPLPPRLNALRRESIKSRRSLDPLRLVTLAATPALHFLSDSQAPTRVSDLGVVPTQAKLFGSTRERSDSSGTWLLMGRTGRVLLEMRVVKLLENNFTIKTLELGFGMLGGNDLRWPFQLNLIRALVPKNHTLPGLGKALARSRLAQVLLKICARRPY
jgi:hypothetical protein